LISPDDIVTVARELQAARWLLRAWKKKVSKPIRRDQLEHLEYVPTADRRRVLPPSVRAAERRSVHPERRLLACL
jgi:hypothetical protein